MKHLCISTFILVLGLFLHSSLNSFFNERRNKFWDYTNDVFKVRVSGGTYIEIKNGIVKQSYIVFFFQPLFGSHDFRFQSKSWTMEEYYKEEIAIQMSEDLIEYHRQRGDL